MDVGIFFLAILEIGGPGHSRQEYADSYIYF
jgi:hypothetical protein